MKLADFGASRALATHSHAAATVVGTPYYMAPEVVRSLPYSEPADVWGLGTILYELLTLRRPYAAPSLAALMHAIVSHPVDAAPLAASGYPPDVWRLATGDALLHPEPARRLTLVGLEQALAAMPPLTSPLLDAHHSLMNGIAIAADGDHETGGVGAPREPPPPSPLPSGPSPSSAFLASQLGTTTNPSLLSMAGA